MRFFRWFLLVCFLAPLSAPSQSFVQRVGTRLSLDGKPFRFSGPNVEWLGLEGYGPHDPQGPRLPSRFEIDDVFATAAEMGARVVRSQTIGDTVGCSQCIEPEPGKFNDHAFQASDYALAVAAKHGIRLIVPFIGDCATCVGGGVGQYLAWNHKANFQDFFTDPAMLAEYEQHMDAVLNHRNAITGVLYKDDPTILAWENCNMCGIVSVLTHGDLHQVEQWSEAVGEHLKEVDKRHLYLDTTGVFRSDPQALIMKSPDIFTFEEYPHWDALLSGGKKTTAETIAQDAATVTGHGKVFIVNEYGWDRTNWASAADLQNVLDMFAHDPNISGDDFWALQGHLDNFGFQPIPADSKVLPFAEHGEDGQWWALYYPGIKTVVMSAEDMGARAQQLRAHAYAMTREPMPKHAVPPKPVITSTVLGGLVAWRGSAGAIDYSVERKDSGAGPWQMICNRCATDADAPWIDPHPILFGAQYRVTAFNADGVASETSLPR